MTEEIELDLSDTDESADSKEQVGLNKKHVHFTSHYSEETSRIHLKPSEIGLVSEPPHNEPPGVMAKALRVKLSRDAFRIANAHHNSCTREATTCLCVVLRDEEKRVKKLVFHNGTGQMLPSMRKEVNALAYGIRNAHLAHAEAQFIDFLLYRARQRTEEVKNNNKPKHPQYTHILGMGCSRKHCQECDTLLKLFLGDRYYPYTSAMSKLPMEKQDLENPTLEAYTEDGEDCMRVTVPTQVQKFKVVQQGSAQQRRSVA